MKKFLLKFALYLIPLPIYLCTILVIDPFNYYNLSSLITNETKLSTSRKLNTPLWKLIEYKHCSTTKIILGDSRAANIEESNVKKLTGSDFYNFSYPGGTLLDIIETFWYADSLTKLQEVYIGLDFNLYNGYETNNNVKQAKTILKNFISYSFSKITFSTSIKNIKKQYLVKNMIIGHPDMNREEFWKYILNFTGTRFYQKYKHPDIHFVELQKISSYCESKNIKLVFFIPPNHVDWQLRINDFKLEEEYDIFIREIDSLAILYNMNKPNDYTNNMNNYNDPLHPKNDSVIIHTIWGKDK